MIKIKITKSKIIDIISDYFPQIDDLSIKYAAWSLLLKDDFDKMKYIGSLDLSNEKSNNDDIDNYWFIDFPITIDDFPYSNSDIYQSGKNLYFIYRDFGGHAPELRCRFFNLELLKMD